MKILVDIRYKNGHEDFWHIEVNYDTLEDFLANSIPETAKCITMHGKSLQDDGVEKGIIINLNEIESIKFNTQ